MGTKKRAGGADDLITMAEAARLRGVSPQAINYLLSRGRLKAVRMAGRRLLRRRDVLGFEPMKAGRPRGKRSRQRRSPRSPPRRPRRPARPAVGGRRPP